MDDVVTIVLIVLYVGYSLFRAVNKRKLAQEKNSQPAAKPARRTFEQVLEELVLDKREEIVIDDEGEEVLEMEGRISPEYSDRLEDVQSSNVFNYEDEKYRQPARSMEDFVSLESNLENYRLTVDTPAMQVISIEEKNADFTWLYDSEDMIDLRKALVYSEILNRPYS